MKIIDRSQSIVAVVIVASFRATSAGADSGSYTTWVDINVPSFHGITPRVGLAYDSHSGNSGVGTGWGLEAGSSIERASPGRGVPRYDDSKDIFLLDGAELIACSGSGSPSPSCLPSVGGTYFSKVENFLKIVHDAKASTWMLWSKDGTKSTYVQERESLNLKKLDWDTTHRWVLSRIQDTHGNAVKYHYTDGVRAASQPADVIAAVYLDRISYACGIACKTIPCRRKDRTCEKPIRRGAILPGAEIKFFWEERPDPVSYGNGQGLLDMGSRLKSIRVMNAGKRVAVYVLQHAESAMSKRSLVSMLKQYGNEAIVCENVGGCSGASYGDVLPVNGVEPTRFEPAQYTAPSMSGSAHTWSSNTDQTQPVASQSNNYESSDFSTFNLELRPDCRSGDINGDGRDDFVCMPSGPAAVITMAIAKAGGGFIWANRQIVANTTVPADWLLTDMTGDGRADIAALQKGNLIVWPSDPNISVPCNFWAPSGAIASCSGFFFPDTNFGFAVGAGPWPTPAWPASTYVPTNHDYDGILGDIRIDSKWVPPNHAENRDDYLFTGDVNGDGLADFTYIYRNTATNTANLCTALSTSDVLVYGFPPCVLDISKWYDQAASRSRFFPADINGDGRMDLVHVAYHPGNIEAAPNNQDHESIETYLSKGDGTYAARISHTAAAWLPDSDWLPGDINGDGKTDIIQKVREPAQAGSVDHSTARLFTSLGDGTFHTFQQKTLHPWFTHCSSIKEAQWIVADFNGDGRDDIGSGFASGGGLCNDPNDKTTRFHVAMSLPNEKCANGLGCFRVAYDYHPNIGSSDEMPPRVGDFNGDGKADIMLTETTHSTTYEAVPNPYEGVEDPFGVLPPPPPPIANTVTRIYLKQYGGLNKSDDLRDTATLEQDGDGRQDYVRVYFRKPGYTIYTYRRDPGTGYTKTETMLSPGDFQGVTTPLNNPDTRGWRTADVGGGANDAPDGKEDLVYVDSDADSIGFNILNYVTGINIYTLMSLGNGTWAKKHQMIPLTVGGMQANRSFDTFVNRRWKLIDIDGDGRADLVYTSYENGQMRIYSLLSNGDGTWTPAPIESLTGFVAGDDHRWLAADINGDGKSDLLFVKKPAGAATSSSVYSLISNFAPGTTNWTPVVFPVASTFVATNHWRAADMNGDSLADLVYMSKDTGVSGVSGVTANYLLSQGDGRFTSRTLGPFSPPVPPKESILAFDDVQNFRLADVNGDGNADLLYVTSGLRANGIQAGVFSLLNHYPALTPLFQQVAGQAFNFQDTQNWSPMDAKNNDGRMDLVYMSAADPPSGATSPVMSMLSMNASPDRMSSISNGLMGLTAITYKTSAGLHTNLPAGSLWNIVDAVTRTDTVMSLSYPTTHAFTGARWSYVEKQSLGFSTSEIRNAKSKSVTYYDQDVEVCGSRISTAIHESLTGNVLSQSGYGYVPERAAAPFLCLSASAVTSECDGLTPPPAANCVSRRGETAYDAYGNVVEAYDHGLMSDLADDRKQQAIYHPNFADYVIGLPASVSLSGYDPATAQWDQMSLSINIYDQATTLDGTLPPRALGEIKKTLVWNNMQDPSEPTDMIATSFDYDAVGNVIKVTGPTGIFETANYECNYKRYPRSLCNSLGQCISQTREAGRDLVTSSTGLNAGDTTEFTADALGRPLTITRPDGSIRVYLYANFGTPSQRIITAVSDDSTGVLAGLYWVNKYFDGFGRNYLNISKGVTGAPTDAVSVERKFLEDTALVTSQSVPHTPNEAPVVTAITYDVWNRPTVTTHVASGLTRKLVYKVGNPQALANVVGSLQTIDENGHGREYFRDIFGRTVHVRESDRECTYTNFEKSCGKTNTYDTTYTYDDLDHMTAITDALGHVTSDVVNSLGWTMQSSDWDLGASSYTYRLDGMVKKEVDARGFSKTYSYDALGRTEVVQHHDNSNPAVVTRTITSSYDRDPMPPHALKGASLGQLVKTVDETTASHTVIDTAHYDLMGRPTEQQRCINGSCAVMSQTFNLAGQLKTLTYPDGETLTSNYNGNGQVSGLSKYLNSVIYTSQGNAAALTYDNGVTTTHGYHPQRFWPQSMAVSTGAYSAAYAFDFTGRMKSRTQTNPAEAAYYQYDDLYRLRKVTSNGPLAQDFEYDPIGNMTFNSKVGTYAYGDPAHTHAVTAITGVAPRTFTYDANGNMTSAGAQTYPVWNHDNRMMQANAGSAANYSYDATGTRVLKTFAGKTTYFFNKYYERTANGEATKYYYVGDQLIAQRDPNPVIPPAISLTFSWAVAGCGGAAGPHDVSFFVNNQSIFPAPALWALPLGGCPANCTTQIKQTTVSDPTILSLVNNPTATSTAYSLNVSSNKAMVAWAKVAINSANAAPRELVIFDFQGGGDAAGNNTVICGTASGPQAVQGPGGWSVSDPSPTNMLTYYHTDHLGSTRVRTDKNGAVIGTPNSYAAFGQATPGQRFGYALSESDDETGLLNMEARYQSPDIGRMLSPDDIISNVFNPQSLNRYSYVLNNPILYNDPTGHQERPVPETVVRDVPWAGRPWSTPIGPSRRDNPARPPGHDIQVGIRPDAPKASAPVRMVDRREANVPIFEDPVVKKNRLAEEERQRNKSVWNLLGSMSSTSAEVCPPGVSSGVCVELASDPSTGKVTGIGAEIDLTPNFMKMTPRIQGNVFQGTKDEFIAMSMSVQIPVGDNTTFQSGAEMKTPISIPGLGKLETSFKVQSTLDLDKWHAGLTGDFVLTKEGAIGGVNIKNEFSAPLFKLGTGGASTPQVGPTGMTVWKNSGGHPHSIYNFGPPPAE